MTVLPGSGSDQARANFPGDNPARSVQDEFFLSGDHS